jgi:two-component system cell cycle response regulator CpdR
MDTPHSLLLVEDEPLTAVALAAALEDGGFQVSLCATGYDALNYIEMEPGIVALVTDIGLGQGPDGWEVARRAREHFPAAPVVYMTGASVRDYADEAVPRSVMLKKPFPVVELVNTVSALLN